MTYASGCYIMILIKAGFRGEVAPPLRWLCTSPEILSTSPKNFRTYLNYIINEIDFERQLCKLNKKV